ncbi:MAG: zinc ribbon domain-containing protein, partial [Candidatus Kapaibacteriota bacterium]
MNSLATMLSSMSEIDSILDDLKEELGDLPQQVKEAEEYVRLKTTQAEQSEKDIHDIEEFKSRSHIRLQEIKDKEDQLAQQQFNVRNNKEFDAITHEIESLRDERNKIYDDQRTIGVKEENLRAIMEQSKTELAEAQQHLSEKEQELTSISHGHNDEILEQTKKRASLAKEIPTSIFAEYERIRTFHKDAAVKVKKNSCSGCFSAVPPQKIVEMRNKSDLMFLCE